MFNPFSKKILINGGLEWYTLKNNIISNKIIHIKNCGDIQPFPNGPIFESAETVYIENCNKNFLLNWLNRYTFPVVKEIYLNTHPCSQYILYRMTDNSNCNIYIDYDFSHYLNIWKISSKNIVAHDVRRCNKERENKLENIDSIVVV